MTTGEGYRAASCPNCGAAQTGDADTVVCGYCGTQVTRAGSPGAGAGHPGGPSSPAVEAIRLHQQSLPAGWIELAFVYASAELVERFGTTFGARLSALANQFINAGAQKLQVNYVDAGPGAGAAFDAMVKLGGKSNTVARKGGVVVEIITADRHAISPVLDALHADQVHNPHHGRW